MEETARSSPIGHRYNLEFFLLHVYRIGPRCAPTLNEPRKYKLALRFHIGYFLEKKKTMHHRSISNDAGKKKPFGQFCLSLAFKCPLNKFIRSRNRIPNYPAKKHIADSTPTNKLYILFMDSLPK